MLLSMTGFGGAQVDVDGVEYGVEIRTVNNRYLKCSIKLPETWGHAEAEVEQLLRKYITRGSVMMKVRMRVRNAMAAYVVNGEALAQYMSQAGRLGDSVKVKVDLGTMLQLPGVCEPPSMEDLCRLTKAALIESIESAARELVEMRRKEGSAIEADLRGNCDLIERAVAVIAERSPEVVEMYHERLTRRVEQLMSGGRVEIDRETLAREVAIFAERCDVAEEISRLSGHIEQFRDSLGIENCGRKLDFISQEMLREANTIASKANDAGIARVVVEIKTAIDRIKEQVQNVE